MRYKRIVILFFIIALIVIVYFSGIQKYINLEQFKAHRGYLQEFVQVNYALSILLYIAFYIAVVALSLPIAALSTVAGGFLFGTVPGAIYANIGATIGATIAFLMVKYFIGDLIQKRYGAYLVWFNREMELYGTNYLLTIHFIAVVPFFLINLLAGLTRTSLWTFIWTTSVGIFPGAFVYAFAGKQLTTINRVRDIFSLNILLAFALLAILSLVPVLFRRLQKR